METIDEEEIKEHLEEEMAKFEDAGYFKRLFKMFVGFGRPRNSPEYKEAMIELQRQSAPLLAILLPLMFIVTLFVVTAVTGDGKKELKVEIVQADQQEEKLEEIETPSTAAWTSTVRRRRSLPRRWICSSRRRDACWTSASAKSWT